LWNFLFFYLIRTKWFFAFSIVYTIDEGV
jgi:hypothetical protein